MQILKYKNKYMKQADPEASVYQANAAKPCKSKNTHDKT